jgi:lysophospholipase L1-like esterase
LNEPNSTREARPPTAARTSAAARAALVALGVALGLLALELGARVVYTRPWIDELGEAQRLSTRDDYRKNSLGLRDAEFERPKPAGLARLLVLGDSFTFGLGVRDDSAPFPERLEAALAPRARAAGYRGLEVHNGGIPGSLTRDWVELWDLAAPALEPDVLLVVFFLRDGTRTGSIPDFFGEIYSEITQRNRDSGLYRLSFLYRSYRDARDRGEVSSRYTERFHEAYFGDEAQTAEWRAAQANLIALRERAAARGIRAGLAIFPVLVGLGERDYPFAAICERIAEFARANAIPALDLLAAFRGLRDSELWVSSVDQHPNARGHAVAAAALEPFAAELLGLEPGTPSPSAP